MVGLNFAKSTCILRGRLLIASVIRAARTRSRNVTAPKHSTTKAIRITFPKFVLHNDWSTPCIKPGSRVHKESVKVKRVGTPFLARSLREKSGLSSPILPRPPWQNTGGWCHSEQPPWPVPAAPNELPPPSTCVPAAACDPTKKSLLLRWDNRSRAPERLDSDETASPVLQQKHPESTTYALNLSWISLIDLRLRRVDLIGAGCHRSRVLGSNMPTGARSCFYPRPGIGLQLLPPSMDLIMSGVKIE